MNQRAFYMINSMMYAKEVAPRTEFPLPCQARARQSIYFLQILLNLNDRILLVLLVRRGRFPAVLWLKIHNQLHSNMIGYI